MLSSRLSVIASVGLSLLLCLIAAATLYSGEAAAGAEAEFNTAPNQDTLPGATSGISVTHALHIPFITAEPTPDGPCYYTEENGTLVIEIESVPPVEQWVAENAIPGFTGQGYYTWYGGDHFSTPGIGVLSYPVQITTAGDYRFFLHNYHDHPTRPDLENDIWFRMGPQDWIKIYSWVDFQWTWASWYDDHHHDPPRGPMIVHLEPGMYTLDIAARSHGMSIDRLTMWQFEGPDSCNIHGCDLTLTQSACLYPES